MSQSAQQLKDAGQQLALSNAGKIWQIAVMFWLGIFLEHIKGNGHSEFTFEEFRVFCNMNELPEPVSLNAWGSLPRIAARKGLCRWTGRVKPAVRKASHGRIIKVWEAA